MPFFQYATYNIFLYKFASDNLDFDEKRQFCACSLDVDILTVGEADAGQRRQDGKNTLNVTAGNKKLAACSRGRA
jgi:hypothetical protein